MLFSHRYDPDEIEEEQRERERRNQINRQFNQFAKRVQQDVWERDFGYANMLFCMHCLLCRRTRKNFIGLSSFAGI